MQHPHSWTTQYDEMRRRDLGRKEKSPWLVLDAESTTIIIEGTKQLVYQNNSVKCKGEEIVFMIMVGIG